MTESIRMEAASAAFLISSAACSSAVVGACTTSKPTSRTILKRSALLSCLGSMSRSTPFLIGGAAESADEVNIDAGRPALTPAEQAAVMEDFRNSRRDGSRIVVTLLQIARTKPRFLARLGMTMRPGYKHELTQRNLFKSILGSSTSVDFINSSQLTSRPV